MAYKIPFRSVCSKADSEKEKAMQKLMNEFKIPYFSSEE
jgi:hypothetical protein